MAPGIRVRLADSVETALRWGEGCLLALEQAPGASPGSPAAAGWTETRHSNRMHSPATGRSFDLPTPQHFSFNSPRGACPVCLGLGQKMVLDPALVVPDEAQTLAGGAIHPYRRLGGKRMASYYQGLLKGMAGHYGVPMDRAWRELPAEFRERLLRGTGAEEISFHHHRAGTPHRVTKAFEGVLPNLERLYAESESEFTRNRLKAYMTLQACDACGGRRLRPEMLAVTLGGGEGGPDGEGAGTGSWVSSFHPPGTSAGARPAPLRGLNLSDFCGLPIDRAIEFLEGLRLDAVQRKVVGEVIAEIRARLGFLREVGLGYLTLDRESGTLSGGEAQRI
ncbi:MAG: excinuclease ABC subunit UvrA, partial [Verrucomicrobiota bacterium]